MSHVADTVVFTFLHEDGPMQEVQKWLTEENQYGPLVEVSDHAGGHKALQCQLWVGAFNYLDIDEFVRVVFAQPWKYPEHVCIAICDEHEDQPRIWRHPLATSETP